MLSDGAQVTISGTASDTAGTVAGVEVSTDGGTNWHPVTGTTSWSYTWNAHGAPSTSIMARAVDDSGNLQSAPSSITVNVGCPCTMAGPNVTPWTIDQGDPGAVEVGVKFKADLDGTITGVRFYKAALNTGTHVGNLWSGETARCLATGTFTAETASGWQQLTFSNPVDISAGTTYVASYYAPRGHYSASSLGVLLLAQPGGGGCSIAHRFTRSAPTAAGTASTRTEEALSFPTSSFNGENYGVDVTFVPKLPPGPAGTVSATAAAGGANVSWIAPATGGLRRRYTVTPFAGSTAQPAVTVTGSPPATSVRVGNLDAGTSYTFKVQAANGSGSSPLSAASNAVAPNPPNPPAAPVGVLASAATQRATVRWTAPDDGGRTISRYSRHAVCRRRRPDRDDRDWIAGGDHRGGPRPDERHGLYVQGVRDQLLSGPARSLRGRTRSPRARHHDSSGRCSGRSTTGSSLQLTPALDADERQSPAS